MNPENRIASLIGLISKAENFLDRMTKHRRPIKSEQHAHITYGYQWEESWGKVMEEIRAELAAALHGLPDIKNLNPLADQLTYRDWKDHAISWINEKDCQRWTAYYNNIKIGWVSYKPASIKEDGDPVWKGFYCCFMENRLGPFPETPEQGKKWIEALFREFLTRASADFGLDSENAGREALPPEVSPPENG